MKNVERLMKIAEELYNMGNLLSTMMYEMDNMSDYVGIELQDIIKEIDDAALKLIDASDLLEERIMKER